MFKGEGVFPSRPYGAGLVIQLAQSALVLKSAKVRDRNSKSKKIFHTQNRYKPRSKALVKGATLYGILSNFYAFTCMIASNFG